MVMISTFYFVVIFFRMANYCMKLAAEQERVVTEIWLPELSNAFEGGHESLNNDCRRVMGLVSIYYYLFLKELEAKHQPMTSSIFSIFYEHYSCDVGLPIPFCPIRHSFKLFVHNLFLIAVLYLFQKYHLHHLFFWSC